MTIRKLPQIKTLPRPKNYQWDPPSDVFQKWAEQPKAADSESDNVISMFDVIGTDWWTDAGVTAKRVAAALRRIGERDVVVQINSPGGDMFEGIAIYNMLAKHNGRVRVEVLGWAASAASIIAMAGDEIAMGLGSFMMVHNAWALVIGNQHDMREAADLFAEFDSGIADIYEARTGRKRADIVALMDKETFMSANTAVKEGFADEVDSKLELPEPENQEPADRALMARRQVEAALSAAGYTRNARSEMLSELGPGIARRDASDPDPAAQRDASRFSLADARRLIEDMKTERAPS